MKEYCIVFSTTRTQYDAECIINHVLDEELVASIQTIPINTYKKENGSYRAVSEILMIFKTKCNLYKDLERVILEWNGNECPEIVVTDIETGLTKYLQWIDSSVN